MYPFPRWNEIYVSSNGTEYAKKCLQEYFKGYGEVREFKSAYSEESKLRSSEKTPVTTFGILSKEMDKKFPKGVIILRPKEYPGLFKEIFALTVVENAEEQMCDQHVLNTEFTAHQLRAYIKYAVSVGRYNGYAGDTTLSNVLSRIENPSFSDLLAISGLLHSTGTWKGNAEFLYNKGIALTELISCREDVYAYLYDKLNSKCCDNPSGQVFEIKEAVRKGMYTNNRMAVEIERLLLECEVPAWYVESMKKILYLFPKTHLIVTLKRDICKFLLINRL